MHWQDWIFSSGGVIFSIALIPSLVSKDKPALSTSLMTGVVLVIFAATYLTLSLLFSGIVTFVSAAAWLTLAVQKYLQAKRAAKK